MASLAIGGALALTSGALTAAVGLEYDTVGDGAKFFSVVALVRIAVAGYALVAFVAAVTALSSRTKLFNTLI